MELMVSPAGISGPGGERDRGGGVLRTPGPRHRLRQRDHLRARGRKTPFFGRGDRSGADAPEAGAPHGDGAAPRSRTGDCAADRNGAHDRGGDPVGGRRGRGRDGARTSADHGKGGELAHGGPRGGRREILRAGVPGVADGAGGVHSARGASGGGKAVFLKNGLQNSRTRDILSEHARGRIAQLVRAPR